MGQPMIRRKPSAMSLRQRDVMMPPGSSLLWRERASVPPVPWQRLHHNGDETTSKRISRRCYLEETNVGALRSPQTGADLHFVSALGRLVAPWSRRDLQEELAFLRRGGVMALADKEDGAVVADLAEELAGLAVAGSAAADVVIAFRAADKLPPAVGGQEIDFAGRLDLQADAGFNRYAGVHPVGAVAVLRRVDHDFHVGVAAHPQDRAQLVELQVKRAEDRRLGLDGRRHDA